MPGFNFLMHYNVYVVFMRDWELLGRQRVMTLMLFVILSELSAVNF